MMKMQKFTSAIDKMGIESNVEFEDNDKYTVTIWDTSNSQYQELKRLYLKLLSRHSQEVIKEAFQLINQLSSLAYHNVSTVTSSNISSLLRKVMYEFKKDDVLNQKIANKEISKELLKLAKHLIKDK